MYIFPTISKMLDGTSNDKLNTLIQKSPPYFADFINQLDQHFTTTMGSNILPMIKPKPFAPPDPDPNLSVITTASAGLWYNWANNAGNKYFAASFSAGTTYIFNKDSPPAAPEILIYKKDKTPIDPPLYSLTLPTIQGVRSILMIDDKKNKHDPYVIFGTFMYPSPHVTSQCSLYKWNFKTKKSAVLLLTINNSNSIRSLDRHKHKDVIFFATQSDSAPSTPAQIYTIKTKYITKNHKHAIQSLIKTTNLKFDHIPLTGSVWSFTLDDDLIYISIPKITADNTKLSGFTTHGRLFYSKIDEFLSEKDDINLYSIIGNESYPDNFVLSTLDSISTFQVQLCKDSDIVYVYSLSDFLYQFSSPSFTSNVTNIISNPSGLGLLELILQLRAIANNIDIDGTRIFTFDKTELSKKTQPIITTIIGDAPYGTLNKSISKNGYNNFTNVYTWASTQDSKGNLYFGTLDIRPELYLLFVSILVKIFPDVTGLSDFMLALPNVIIIFITELIFNINFDISTFSLTDKDLYFDIIKIDAEQNISKITSSGFSDSEYLSSTADDGVRNLDVIKNEKGEFLLIGSTCYQPTNSAKLYSLKLSDGKE